MGVPSMCTIVRTEDAGSIPLPPTALISPSCLTSLAQKVCVFSDLFRPCLKKVNELNTMLFNNYIKVCVRYYIYLDKRS